jgi:hypothetical protein
MDISLQIDRRRRSVAVSKRKHCIQTQNPRNLYEWIENKKVIINGI